MSKITENPLKIAFFFRLPLKFPAKYGIIEMIQTKAVPHGKKQKGAWTAPRSTNVNMAEYRSSGKELRKSPKGLIAGLLSVALVAVTAFAVRYVRAGMQSLELTDDERSAADLMLPSETETTLDPNRVMYESRDVFLSDISRGTLVLVNPEHTIEDQELGLVNVAESKNEYLSVGDVYIRLQKQAMDAMNSLAKGFFDKTGHQDLMIATGYRSYAEQQELYERDLQRTGENYSAQYAIPGASEFESGLGLELMIYSGGRFDQFTGEDDYAWVLNHCSDYGFIQRYPAEKEDITGVRDQTAILRYVGVPHARYMRDHDLTLEEYVQLLENYPFESAHLLMEDNRGKEYEVYYVPADPDSGAEVVSVPIPTSLHYAISGSNRNGFYVTVELDPYAATTQTTVETEPAAEEEIPAEEIPETEPTE